MAYPLHSIVALTNALGAESGSLWDVFNDLVGALTTAQERVEILARPGIDDHGLRLLGQVGEPTQLLTAKYVLDIATANTKLLAYQTLIGQEYGVAIYQASVKHWPYDVLAVQFAEQPRQVAKVVGNVTGTEQVRMVCRWTVIPRKV